MQLAAIRVGGVLNQSDLARDAGLPVSTAQRYLDLLVTSYQMVRVPAYAVNRTKRLVKSPKLYWRDTALAMHLAGETEPRGEHLENLILHDLLVWKELQVAHPQILYWRTRTREEVDFVIKWTDGCCRLRSRPHGQSATPTRGHSARSWRSIPTRLVEA